MDNVSTFIFWILIYLIIVVYSTNYKFAYDQAHQSHYTVVNFAVQRN